MKEIQLGPQPNDGTFSFPVGKMADTGQHHLIKSRLLRVSREL